MNENHTFLSVRDLVVEYTSDEQIIYAVNGVSFDLEKGKTLGLVGETGAGKTSVAKAILRILPDPPAKIQNGQVLLEGTDLIGLSEPDMQKIRGRRISMVFQDPMTALNPTMRIGDQIAEGILAHEKISKTEARQKAEKMLEMVGIPGSRYREYPHQFSGGMKQRVVIAIALACNPELLLADEPTTALDVTIQAQVLDLINELKVKQGTSMILITHDLGVVAETCDDVAVMYAGEIIEFGSLADVFDHPTHPYAKGLFGALPDMSENSDRLNPIVGLPPDPSNLPEGCKFHPRCPYATDICREKAIPMLDIGGKHQCRCLKAQEDQAEKEVSHG